MVSGLIYRLFDEMPAPGVPVIDLTAGASTVTDYSGRWRLPVPVGNNVRVRIVSSTEMIDVINFILLFPGTTEITYRVNSNCGASITDVREVSIMEGAVSRPNPPALPSDYVLSEATRNVVLPAPGGGNPGNLPWIGYFWLTAPNITVGICSSVDQATRTAAETAIDRWNESSQRGLAWRLIRNDEACSDGFTAPKLLITREQFSRYRFVLGRAAAKDLNGSDCKVDLNGTVCWASVVRVQVNPPGFDRLRADEQVATMLHEIGHALGLAHANGCGDSVMWFDTGCIWSPTQHPGMDDIASLNDLLGVTLQVLRPQPQPVPAPVAGP
jgi:hypothetical protein